MTTSEANRNQHERRRRARVVVPAGEMPPNWRRLTPEAKADFTEEDLVKLLEEEFWWAPWAKRHGRHTAYNAYACRCPCCKRFHTAWQRDHYVPGSRSKKGDPS